MGKKKKQLKLHSKSIDSFILEELSSKDFTLNPE